MTSTSMIYSIQSSRSFANTISGIMALAIAAVLGYMTYSEGFPGGGIFLTLVLFAFGLIGLSFRKVSTFDKIKNRFTVKTSILGLGYTEKYEMRDFKSLEFHLRNKKTKKDVSETSSEFMDFRVYANFEEEGQPFRLQLFADSNAKEAREKADQISGFLDVELQIVDNRKGIEKQIHDDEAKPSSKNIE